MSGLGTNINSIERERRGEYFLLTFSDTERSSSRSEIIHSLFSVTFCFALSYVLLVSFLVQPILLYYI